MQNIMAQLRHEASHEADPEAALKEIEADAEEYRSIAVRRVRLGLLLSEIGAANGIEVSQQEMNRLIGQAAAQYQPKDREAFVRYIQQNAMAAAQLRAPLYEDKVVDFLFSKAEISDRTVDPRRAGSRPRERGRPCPRPGLRPRSWRRRSRSRRRPRPRSRLPRRKRLRPRPSQGRAQQEGEASQEGRSKAPAKAEKAAAKKAPAKKPAAKKK